MSPRTRFKLTALPQICRFLLRPWRRRDAGCSHSGHTHVLNLRLAATRRGCVDCDWSSPIPQLRVSPTSPTHDHLRTSPNPAHRRLRVITVSYMTSTDGFYIRSTATGRPRLLLIRNTRGHARLAVADPWARPACATPKTETLAPGPDQTYSQSGSAFASVWHGVVCPVR